MGGKITRELKIKLIKESIKSPRLETGQMAVTWLKRSLSSFFVMVTAALRLTSLMAKRVVVIIRMAIAAVRLTSLMTR